MNLFLLFLYTFTVLAFVLGIAHLFEERIYIYLHRDLGESNGGKAEEGTVSDILGLCWGYSKELGLFWCRVSRRQLRERWSTLQHVVAKISSERLTPTILKERGWWTDYHLNP